MEMNTRLQVEHPVTELITGIDLVEWQLRSRTRRAACRHRRRRSRSAGAAIEARLYAEDPAHDYLPSVGRITHLRWPAAAPDLRLDAGVEAGDEVTPFYDPMLGKLIAWGDTRVAGGRSAARGARRAARSLGVTTNRALLMSVLADEEFLRRRRSRRIFSMRGIGT